MRDMLQFYINGEWVDPVSPNPFDVINPATEAVCGRISLGTAADVDKAVAAAKAAFPAFSQTSREERLDLLQAILDGFMARYNEVAEAIMEEMGAPWSVASREQAGSGPQHIKAAIRALKSVEFARRCVWFDHTMELAGQSGRGQSCTSFGGRLHHGPKTQRDCTV